MEWFQWWPAFIEIIRFFGRIIIWTKSQKKKIRRKPLHCFKRIYYGSNWFLERYLRRRLQVFTSHANIEYFEIQHDIMEYIRFEKKWKYVCMCGTECLHLMLIIYKPNARVEINGVRRAPVYSIKHQPFIQPCYFAPPFSMSNVDWQSQGFLVPHSTMFAHSTWRSHDRKNQNQS